MAYVYCDVATLVSEGRRCLFEKALSWPFLRSGDPPAETGRFADLSCSSDNWPSWNEPVVEETGR